MRDERLSLVEWTHIVLDIETSDIPCRWTVSLVKLESLKEWIVLITTVQAVEKHWHDHQFAIQSLTIEGFFLSDTLRGAVNESHLKIHLSTFKLVLRWSNEV